jgi:small subunit ribosomal protein S15
MLEKEEKEEIIKKYKLHDVDTGSFEVQIALLTEKNQKTCFTLERTQKRFGFKKRFVKNGGKKEKTIKKVKRRG